MTWARLLGTAPRPRPYVVTALLAAACASPQGGPAREHPVSFSASALPEGATSVEPGGRLTIAVKANIPAGWHLYGLNTPPGGPLASTITVGPPSVARAAGTIGAPVPIITRDPGFGVMTEMYADSATFLVPVEVVNSVRPGPHVVTVLAYYQTCNDRYCLPPVTDTLPVKIAVTLARIRQ